MTTEECPEPGTRARGHETWYIGLLSALYLATFLIRLSYGIITITFPDYTGIEENTSFGFLWAAGPLAEVFTVLLIGNLIDKYGRRWALLMGLMAGALSNFLIAVSTNFAVLYIVTALHGAASGTILVTSLALLADYVPLERRGREIGMFDGVNLAGWGVGFLIGGILKDHLDDLVWSFVISGVLALIGLIYAYFELREPEWKTHVVSDLRPGRILSVLRRRSILLLVLPWFVIYMLIGDVFAFFPKTTGQEMGLEGWVIGAALAAGTIAIVLFQRGYGALSDRIGRVKVMSIGIVGIIVLMVLVGVALGTAPNPEEGVERRTYGLEGEDPLPGAVLLRGNGTIDNGTIMSLDGGEVVYSFGPLGHKERIIRWARPQWDGGNATVTVEWYDEVEEVTKSAVMSRDEKEVLPDDPVEINITVTVGPGQDASVEGLRIEVEYAPPYIDFLGAMTERPLILVGIGISGIMSGAFAPAALASLADEAKTKARGVTMAIYIVMIGLGQVVGPILTGWLMDCYGAMGFIMFLAGAGVFLAVIMLLRWRDTSFTGPSCLDEALEEIDDLYEEE